MALIGVRIFDGLFHGDKSSAVNLKAAMACKVTHVVNCCAKEVPSLWADRGIKYLEYDWDECGKANILDKEDRVVSEVFDFIEEALAHEEGVLLHSRTGEQASCCILAAFLMKKFNWSLDKTMEFLLSRHRLGAKLCVEYRKQLRSYEQRLETELSGNLAAHLQPLTGDWSDVDHRQPCAEEVLISNTLLNVKASSQRAASKEIVGIDSRSGSKESCRSGSKESLAIRRGASCPQLSDLSISEPHTPIQRSCSLKTVTTWADEVSRGPLVEEVQEPTTPSEHSSKRRTPRRVRRTTKVWGPMKSALKGSTVASHAS
jgi:protein-tyrosine phosphatase